MTASKICLVIVNLCSMYMQELRIDGELFETHSITSSNLRASKQLRKMDSNTHCFAGIQKPIAICLIIAAKSKV
jgi:hypothetical protein